MKSLKKFLVLSCLILTALAKRKDFENFVKEHNARPDKTWVAELSKGINYDDDVALRSLVGTILETDEVVEKKVKILKAKGELQSDGQGRRLQSLLSSVDLRVTYRRCPSIADIRNQSQCGSCWAFATANVITDAYCIQKGIIRSFAPQDLLTCCGSLCTGTSTDGCQGGYLNGAYSSMKIQGATTGEKYADTNNKCKPYFLSPAATVSAVAPPCTNTCAISTVSNQRQKITGYRAFYGEAEMMKELATRGPITSAFKVYKDFYAYRSGVYKSNRMGYLGGHAIRIIGYGYDSVSKLKYWLIANSWGSGWGESGFFKMRRGSNECNIEAYYSYAPIF